MNIGLSSKFDNGIRTDYSRSTTGSIVDKIQLCTPKSKVCESSSLNPCLTMIKRLDSECKAHNAARAQFIELVQHKRPNSELDPDVARSLASKMKDTSSNQLSRLYSTYRVPSIARNQRFTKALT